MHRNKRGVSQALSILILAAGLIFAQAVYAQTWTTLGLPGGVHHKTVFIDYQTETQGRSVQAVASVNMADKLCIKGWDGDSWDADWTRIGNFYSTWGLDWASIGTAPNDYAYMVYSGWQAMRVYKYDGGWQDQTASIFGTTNPSYRVEDCVFYGDADGDLAANRILISRSQDTPDNKGLFRWSGSAWVLISGSNTATDGYGGRMWRSMGDNRIVYMTGPGPGNPGDTNLPRIWYMNVNDNISSGFSVNQVLRTSINTELSDIYKTPWISQWQDGEDLYQYLISSSKEGATYHTTDIWYRLYQNETTPWTKLIENIEDDFPDAFSSGIIDEDIRIAGRSYTASNTTYHRVYVALDSYGCMAYDTRNNQQEYVNMNNISDEDNRLQVFRHRYLSICPFGSDDDNDMLFYSNQSK